MKNKQKNEIQAEKNNGIIDGKYSVGKYYGTPFQKRIHELLDPEIHPEYSQTALARKLNINPQAVSQYYKGDAYPSLGKLEMIADYFDVSVDYLLGRTKVPSPNTEIQAVCEYTGLSQESINVLHNLYEELKIKNETQFSYSPIEINGITKDWIITNENESYLASICMREIEEKESIFSLLNTLICSQILEQFSFYMNSEILEDNYIKNLNFLGERLAGATEIISSEIISLGIQTYCSNMIQRLSQEIKNQGREKLFPFLTDFISRLKEESDLSFKKTINEMMQKKGIMQKTDEGEDDHGKHSRKTR